MATGRLFQGRQIGVHTGFFRKNQSNQMDYCASEMNISQEINVRINWVAISSELIYWKKKLRN